MKYMFFIKKSSKETFCCPLKKIKPYLTFEHEMLTTLLLCKLVRFKQFLFEKEIMFEKTAEKSIKSNLKETAFVFWYE